MNYGLVLVTLIMTTMACTTNRSDSSQQELLRIGYHSAVDNAERDYFVFLPKGYHSEPEKNWPVMLFLHGNGERGNGKDELDYVLSHGPLFEAWIQKKDIPFVIISPQLHMFDFNQRGLSYIDNRKLSDIPQRLAQGVSARPNAFSTDENIIRNASVDNMEQMEPLLPLGWEQVEADLLNMFEQVKNNYRVDSNRTYLSGLSYGGFGTWFMASRHPEKFAAIAPVVGWGHPSFMAPIAKQQLPIWQFAGGRDSAVQIQYFYAGLNELEQLGHKNVRFTVHEDMEHDAWTRVYASDDLYQWFLQHDLVNR